MGKRNIDRGHSEGNVPDSIEEMDDMSWGWKDEDNSLGSGRSRIDFPLRNYEKEKWSQTSGHEETPGELM
jgi:hypothetical protein